MSRRIRDSVEEVVSGKPFFKFNRCIHAATHNITIYKDCKVVIGSLGFGVHNPFYEYGGVNYKVVKDFFKKGCDLHCWLETSDGKVIDVFHKEYIMICKLWGRDVNYGNKKKIKLNKPFELTYEELKNEGLSYIPAPQQTQDILLKIFKINSYVFP